jgi:hypothetical protein
LLFRFLIFAMSASLLHSIFQSFQSQVQVWGYAPHAAFPPVDGHIPHSQKVRQLLLSQTMPLAPP